MDAYLVFLATLHFVYAASSVTCPNGWVTHGTGCYHFSHGKMNWADAMVMCRLDGGTLAEIDDAAENTYLQAAAKLQGGQFWVGGSDEAEDNVWVWMTSKKAVSASLANWGPGQPDNAHGDENCLEINFIGRNWNDRPCSTVQKYICEMMAGTDSTEIVG